MANTIIIPIDRTSIRRNANAGSTSSVAVLGHDHHRTVCKVEGGMFITEQQTSHDGEHWEWTTQQAVSRRPSGFKEGVHNEGSEALTEEYSHWPVPPYSFGYVPTLVTCRNCGSIFPHTKLESDSFPDGEGGEMMVYRICPECRASDCCDIEFEKFVPPAS